MKIQHEDLFSNNKGIVTDKIITINSAQIDEIAPNGDLDACS